MRFGLILASQVCAVALVGQAAAQSPKPSRETLVAQAEPAAPPPATDAVPAPAPAEPAMPAFVEPAPPPPPPPPPPPADKPLFRFYGILKPTIVAANALESFGQQNFSAPTAVANPVFVADHDDIAWSFQAQQTRFGVAVGEGLPVTGKLEIDFIDSSLPPGFNRSSPAQATTPRLRQAYVEWTMMEGHKLTIGQLWDFFSPLNNHTYNLVGNLFQSGNTGFMRHQLGYSGNFGPIEAALVFGLTAQNLGAALNQIEYGKMPTIVPRVSYRKGKEVWAGVSAIVSRVSFEVNTPNEDTHMVYGGNLFGDLTFGKINLRAEAYFGQNLNNLGVLSLANARHSAAGPEYDLTEAGGWLSAKFTATPNHSAYLVVGGAAVLNSDDLAPGYTAAVAADPTMGIAAAPAARTGVGIQNNMSLRVGYAYSPFTGFSLLAEPFIIITKHQLADAEEALYDETRKGGGIEFGGMYSF